MRQGIGLRAYGSNDPLVAYKREAHDMWDQLLENIRSTVARQLFHARLVAGAAGSTAGRRRRKCRRAVQATSPTPPPRGVAPRRRPAPGQ